MCNVFGFVVASLSKPWLDIGIKNIQVYDVAYDCCKQLCDVLYMGKLLNQACCSLITPATSAVCQ